MEAKITYAFINLEGASQFGEAIRRFRKLRGFTQQQLAEAAEKLRDFGNICVFGGEDAMQGIDLATDTLA